MPTAVLIVDDLMHVRSRIRSILEDADLSVAGEAKDGVEAIELYEALRPDVVTMDLVMPRMNGVEAARAIRTLDPRALIVPVSALAHPSVQAASLEAGMFGFVSKPVDPLELLAEIREALRSRGHGV